MTNPNPTALDNEEQALIDSFERGEWVAVGLSAADKQAFAEAAQNTLQKQEKQQISIKLNAADIRAIKAKALETGIPYQNIIGALVHNYVVGKIRLEI